MRAQSGQPIGTLHSNRRSTVTAYLNQELRDHLHVAVGLRHLLHAVTAEDWPERQSYFRETRELTQTHANTLSDACKGRSNTLKIKTQSHQYITVACRLHSQPHQNIPTTGNMSDTEKLLIYS